MARTDLILVNPGAHAQVFGILGSALSGIEPPTWCAMIASFVRSRGYTVRVIDAEGENLSPDQTASRVSEYDPAIAFVVVLGNNPSASSTPKMTAAGELLRAIKGRAPQVITMIGGLHPSALPERTLREEAADYLCQGEGFHTALGLLELIREGRVPAEPVVPGLWYRQDGQVRSNPLAPLVNPDDLPMAAWDLLPMGKYRAHNWHCLSHLDHRSPYAAIYTSVGCPFNCSYCNIRAMQNLKPGIRFRSPHNVVAEIDYLVKNFNIKNFKFIDELFALKEDRVNRICDLIIEGGYDLNIWAYARVDTVNERMLRKMKQAGINWLAYGFESGNKEVRQGVEKKFDQETMRRAVEMTHAAGINIIANFMFGLPDDDLASMRETLDMAKEFNCAYANFYCVMAYPGSQLYDDSVRDGTPLPATWHGFGQYSADTVPLATKHLGGEEVLAFRDTAFNEYFSDPRYLKMIEGKFGPDVVEHIKTMLGHRLVRRLTADSAIPARE